MAQETVRLAEYAAALRYEDLPGEVVAAARDCIIDTIAACICGSALPWSRIVIDYAERTGPGGMSRILGCGSAVQAPAAALANGALAHAFELDALTRPGAGAIPARQCCRQPSPSRNRRAPPPAVATLSPPLSPVTR